MRIPRAYCRVIGAGTWRRLYLRSNNAQPTDTCFIPRQQPRASLPKKKRRCWSGTQTLTDQQQGNSPWARTGYELLSPDPCYREANRLIPNRQDLTNSNTLHPEARSGRRGRSSRISWTSSTPSRRLQVAGFLGIWACIPASG